MEYTGRRQNNFNAHAQVFALDVGRPYNAAATASAPRGSANPSDPVSPAVVTAESVVITSNLPAFPGS